MKKNLLKLVNLFVFSLIIISLSTVSYAETTDTIRVGYVFTSGYQEGGDGEYKTGLGYDYYQKISYYTGWNYEYVYGGFGELLDKLKTGEIDIMGNVSYTEERAEEIDFSEHEQGWESYYLYTLKDNDSLDESNIKELNKKTVGISKGSIQYNLFQDWCAEKGVECEIIEYSDKAQREEDLNSGKIFAVVVPTVMANNPDYLNWRAAVKIGESSYYFGLSKHCGDTVKEKLDAALEAIFDANPNYFVEQFNKYYGGKMMESDFWTAEEKENLSEHNNMVRVGYLDNYLPFCDMDDNGNLLGVLADIAQMTQDNLGIYFECTSFARYDDMKAALDSGSLDVIFPVRGDYWAAEQQNLFLSDIVCGSNSVLIYKGEYTEDKVKCIAISDASPFQKYSAMISYPDAELLVRETTDDCVKAVLDGKAGSTIFLYETYKVNGIKISAARHLNQTEVADSADVCFGVRHGDTEALSMCQKWMSIIGDDLINQSVVSNSNRERTFTLQDFVEANIDGVLVAVCLIIAAIIAGAFLYVKRNRQRNLKLLEAIKDAEKAKRELVEQELKAETYRLKTEQELNNSRIKVMMSQMRPHFLYNALSAIQTIVAVDPDYAASLIFDFTTHLRSSITALSSDEPIPFSDELKNISAYLNIEQMRSGDSLKIEYDICCKAFKVLPLSIQPFAENAAQHGIYPKGEQGGTIIVRSFEQEKGYVVEIEDDGIGFDVEKVLNENSASVGLKNTIFRLKTATHASVSINSKIGEGTKVRIIIPKNQGEGARQE